MAARRARQSAAVETATAAYRQEEDVLGQFLDQRCERGKGEVEIAVLRKAYEDFCDEVGEKHVGAIRLGKQLAKRGIRSGKTAGKRTYQGVELRP